MVIKNYEICEGNIKELEIINRLSTLTGKLPEQLGNLNHSWNSPEGGYAISFEVDKSKRSFEGDKSKREELRIRRIYLSTKEEVTSIIQKHLEEACSERGIRFK